MRCSPPSGWEIIDTWPPYQTDYDPGLPFEMRLSFAAGQRREVTFKMRDQNGMIHWAYDFSPVSAGGSGQIGKPLCDTTLVVDGQPLALHYRPNSTDPGACIYVNLDVHAPQDGSASDICI